MVLINQLGAIFVKQSRKPQVKLAYIAASMFFCLFSLMASAAPLNGHSQVTSNKAGAVASVNPIATQAGIDAFNKGGNAIDAAVAVAYTLGVVDSHNSGIGGGCFIVIHWADGRIEAIDGREMAPATAKREMFLIDGEPASHLSRTGALSIGIPGSVAAFDYIQTKGGKLKRGDVILPAAKLAADGFSVDGSFAGRLNWRKDAIKAFPATAAVLLKENGEAYKAGETLIQKDLALTYSNIAKQGPSYFYQGDFAKKIDTWMKANSGRIRFDDFKNYTIKNREPVKSSFQGYTLYGFPPPSSGGVHVAQILNILDRYDIKKLSEAERYHLLLESMKLAFADRAFWLGDADFANVPKGLISTEYATTLNKKINMKTATEVPNYNKPPGADDDFFNKHTTHISTADKDGNWVSITTTLNTSFGSKVIIPGTGVLMNNQMDDFSIKPRIPNAFGLIGADANSVQPKKRPLSSMSPTIVMKNGKPVMALGAAGGPTIITQVVQTLVNYLGLELSLEEAMMTSRVHHQWHPVQGFVEESASAELIKELETMGHKLRSRGYFGTSQSIALEKGEFVTQSEPRIKFRN